MLTVANDLGCSIRSIFIIILFFYVALKVCSFRQLLRRVSSKTWLKPQRTERKGLFHLNRYAQAIFCINRQYPAYQIDTYSLQTQNNRYWISKHRNPVVVHSLGLEQAGPTLTWACSICLSNYSNGPTDWIMQFN